MVKYIFKVYDLKDQECISQVITDVDHMLDTIKVLSELGIVKGWILDGKDNDNDN